MMIYILLISGILLGLGFSYLLTRQIIYISRHYQLIAFPRHDRFHSEPTPLMGGVAIYLAFLLGLMVMGLMPWVQGLILLLGSSAALIGLLTRHYRLYMDLATVTWLAYCLSLLMGASPADHRTLWMLAGAQILFFTGIYDDICNLHALPKLILQILAATVFVFQVSTITFVPVPYNYMISILWLVSIINAFNLIDNMNGLSGGVAAIAALFFAMISLYNSQITLGFHCFIFMGALLGFLPHNFPRAKIFMGDGGSLVIGYILGTIGILGSWKTSSSGLSIFIPVLVLAYPVFDVILVVTNRILEGRPIYLGGKDHSSHRLVKLGLSPADAVLFLFFLAFLTGFTAFFLTMIDFKQALKMLFFLIAVLFIFGLRLSRIKNHEN